MGLPQPGCTSPQNLVMSAAQACRSAFRAATSEALGACLRIVEAGLGQLADETCAVAGSAMDRNKAAETTAARMASP